MRFSIISGVLVAVARKLRRGLGPGQTGAACVEAIQSILAGLFGVCNYVLFLQALENRLDEAGHEKNGKYVQFTSVYVCNSFCKTLT